MSTKLRLSASVDPEVLSAAQEAVDAGRAANISAWVNQALHRQAEHDRRMDALDEFLAQYEADEGAITDQEIADATRNARARALVVRSARRGSASPSKSRKRTTGRRR
jgi:hypothetical protein